MEKRYLNVLSHIKLMMILLNILILLYMEIIILYTTFRIENDGMARSFLSHITRVPHKPLETCFLVFFWFVVLLLLIRTRERLPAGSDQNALIALMEVACAICVIMYSYVAYNGFLLLVIADIATSIRRRNIQITFLFVMSITYIFTNYNIISLMAPMVAFSDFLYLYSTGFRSSLIAIFNIFESTNLICFIIYMIILMRSQMKETEQIKKLNQSLVEANEKLRDFANVQKQLGETEERNRIAREIHDTLGHTMTGLAAGLDACSMLIDVSVPDTKNQIKLLADVARTGLGDIRRSVNKLRPDALEKNTLEVALEDMIHETRLMSDIEIDYENTYTSAMLSEDEEETVFRIVQEGLTNAIRHGKATSVMIHIYEEGKWYVIDMQDNGIGCDKIKAGFGLIHMRERIDIVHGILSLDGSHGFHIHAKLPIRQGESYD